MKPKRDYGNILLWSAVLVGAPRWAGAMLAADLASVDGIASLILNAANMLSGFAMGILEVVAVAYMLDAIRQMRSGRGKPGFRFWGTVAFSAGLLALTPLILSPYLVSRMMGESVSTVLNSMFWRYAWAVAVVIAPGCGVAGVAFARPGLVGLSTNVSDADKRSNDAPTMPDQRSKVAGKNGATPGDEYPRSCECGFVASNRYAWAGHRSRCKLSVAAGDNGHGSDDADVS